MAPKNERIQRQEDIWDIGNSWKEGESCALVGIGSSGKSRLVQSFLKEEVQRYLFGDELHRFLLIYVDGNGLLEDGAWGLYEEMLDSAMNEITKWAVRNNMHPMTNEMYQELYRYHKAVIEKEEKLAYRWVSRAVSMLFRVGKFKRIVFMFDDIDHLLRAEALEPKLFRHLKSLRDHNKYDLCYMVSTRKTVNDLAGERMEEIDGFYKLLKTNTTPIGVYKLVDAKLMLQELIKRNKFEVRSEIQTELIRNSGCHPGLLRVSFFAMIRNQQELEKRLGFSLQAQDGEPETWQIYDEEAFRKAIREALVNFQPVQEECYSIWHGLSGDERVVLRRMVEHEPFTEYVEAINQLETKKLLVPGQMNPYAIFSPVFAALVPWLSTGKWNNSK